jgi:putative ABC transport system permease protein
MSSVFHPFRQLTKAPGFTAVAVLTLALGVGANTAIFSVVHAVLLHPFPYADSDRLLFIGENRVGQDGNMPVTYPDFVDWRKSAKSFTGLSFATGRSYTLTQVAEPAIIRGAGVSASLWPQLGIKPMLGRSFTESEDQLGASPVCVLSEALWRQRFAADPGVLGRSVTLDGKAYTVIGVMPPRFKFWAGDLWLPVALDSDSELMRSRVLRSDAWAVGTPKPGVTTEQAVAELNVIARQIAQAHPDSNKGIGVHAQLLSEAVTGGFRQPLLVLLAAVGCVLLIACANVANLLLARTAARQREYAVRVALGATRRQLVAQMLLEILPLVFFGGAAGVLLGSWGLHGLLLILPPDAVPAEAQITVNAWVMLGSFAVVALTMLAFALFPAFESARPPAHEALQEGSRGTASTRTSRVRSVLIVTEVSLAVALLVGAGLFIRSLARLNFVDPGFNARNLLVTQIQLPLSRYASGRQATAFFTELVERVRPLPGVQAVAATSNAPFLGGTGMPLITEGRSYNDLSELEGVQFSLVLGDYFKAQGLGLVSGRTFTAADRAGAAPVVILNEAAVKRFLPKGDPLGQRVMLGVPPNLNKPGLLPPGFDRFQWTTVVGVVRSARHFALGIEAPPMAYLPVEQSWDVAQLRGTMVLLLRSDGDPLRYVPDLRSILNSIDRDQPMGRVTAMETIIAESLRQSRFNTVLLGLFAGVALALAVIGIYGVVTWNVTQRTREFGIRHALGAEAGQVLRLVLRQSMRLVLVGLAIGLLASLAGARLLQSMLYEVSALDPWTFAGVALLLAGVAMVACVVPARRAARVDPIVALRAD